MTKSYFLIVISIFLGVIFILPFFNHGILNIGNIFGLILAAFFLCYGMFYEQVNEKIKNLWGLTPWKAVFSIFFVIVVLVLVFVSFATYNMISAANNPPEKETTVIVLGCKVNQNGPSLTLLKRLEAAYDYLLKNPDVPCILSGGQGSDEHISEAQAMCNWLTERGISKERLYIEDKSTSTWENISFSNEIIEKGNLPPAVTLITNNFHQYRAQEIAKNYGLETYGVSGDTPLYLLPTYYIRELGGIFVELYINS